MPTLTLDLPYEKVTASSAETIAREVVRSSWEDYQPAPAPGTGSEAVEAAIDYTLARPHPRDHGADDEPDAPSAWAALDSAAP